MAEPVIITVAITGAVPKKKDNPAVPVTPAQQVESTHEAFEAGASPISTGRCRKACASTAPG
jgi:3-keto-5-aminohexanoate cleavage enzyme